jgi:hypothetical protein
MFQGTIYLFASPLIVLVILRLLMGAIEAPAFPANSRLSVQWFPNKERGFVTAVYQAAQYISLGIVTPLMTLILHNMSWHYVFYYIGAIGVVLGIVWLAKIRDPLQHKKINQQELDYIREGGGEPELGNAKKSEKISCPDQKRLCESHDDRRVYRSVLRNVYHLVLPDLVSDLFISGKRDVDSQGRVYCQYSGDRRVYWRPDGRRVF